MVNWSESDLRRLFGERIYNRGRELQSTGAVTSLSIDGNTNTRIIASVTTKDHQIYKPEIKIVPFQYNTHKFSMKALCSCPLRYNCEHAAAAVLEAKSVLQRQQENITLPIHGSASTPALASSVSTQPSAPVVLTSKSSELSWQMKTWIINAKDQAGVNSLINEPLSQAVIYRIANHSIKKGDPKKLSVRPFITRILKNGQYSKTGSDGFISLIRYLDKQYGAIKGSVQLKEDRTICSLAKTTSTSDEGRYYYGYSQDIWWAPSDIELTDIFMRRIVATGRAYISTAKPENWRETQDVGPVRLGEERQAQAQWRIASDGSQTPSLVTDREGLVILTAASPWYFDPLTCEVGPLRCSLSQQQLEIFLSAPKIKSEESATVRKMLEDSQVQLAIPKPHRVREYDSTQNARKPVPVLQFIPNNQHADDNSVTANKSIYNKGYLSVAFDYGNNNVVVADPNASVYAMHDGEDIVMVPRNRAAEKKAMAKLQEVGLSTIPEMASMGILAPADGENISPWFWPEIANEIAPQLAEDGFKISGFDKLNLNIINPDDDAIDAEMQRGSGGDWWFSLDLGIQVDGKRVSLLPLLVAMIRRMQSPSDVDKVTARETCYAPLPDGSLIALPSERVRSILKTLVELFDDKKAVGEDGKMEIPLDVASAMMQLEAVTKHRWVGDEALRRMLRQLGDFNGITQVDLPTGLNAELRHYQKQGYDWLHFLGQVGLGGILADDMGLGKTLQALSYILAITNNKTFGLPNLVIMPTSLVGNWLQEAGRFAPSLRMLVLHGHDRGDRFSDIINADVVLTTYPLVVRDIELLSEQKWGLIVLDEAQAIKNPTAKTTQMVCQLNAKQRICLSGTPVENHLGEAWSLFNFLMPGLLGSYGEFTKRYRVPIEKRGDKERRELLARRLKPFVLRRLKSKVAAELPPRTEIIRRVTLPDDQRDLYETVRSVMNEKVLQEIADKGFNRSRIVILDALLKLRQICCDPRLLKIKAAAKVKTSAKLAELMEMLPTLIEDGRKVLLFSQFTSMLDLVKQELEKTDIKYVELRGSTTDRRTPVAEFQAGKVPLFLISLKAGGTGLNLTAADTVIHFDPWWNPAVENQATDRAHRIGQDKAVFVYKLIVEGTVEERILDLQSRKAGLAGAIFGGDGQSETTALTKDDLHWLLGG